LWLKDTRKTIKGKNIAEVSKKAGEMCRRVVKTGEKENGADIQSGTMLTGWIPMSK